jgi:hypothetical protein
VLTVAQGEFTAKDLRRGTIFAAKRIWVVIGVFYGLLVVSICFGSISSGKTWMDQLPTLGGVVVVVGFVAASVWYRVSRTLRKSPALQGVIRYEFDETGFRIIGPHTAADWKWPGLLKWRANKTTLLLYPNPRLAQVVPKRFFSSEQDFAAVLELLRTYVSKKKQP